MPVTPTIAPTTVTWASRCVAVGTRPFGWDTIRAALAGPHPSGPLEDLPLHLPYAGRDGARHFHPGCPPRDRHKRPLIDPSVTHTTLGQLRTDLRTVTQIHTCAQDFTAWLSADIRWELALLADAAVLTAGWRDALDHADRAGRPVLPTDATPLTAGLLDALTDQTAGYAAANPDRAHIAGLAAALRDVRDAWVSLAARADEVAAADPHTAVLTWQRARGLPALTGTPRQVRWAEKIRHEMVTSVAEHADEVAARETSAGVWIALHRQDPGDVLSGWLGIRERAAERARRQADLDRQLRRW